MDIGEIIKLFNTQQEEKKSKDNIPPEILKQYPYGEFPIRYTKLGQEHIRKNSENRYANNNINTDKSTTQNSDIMSLLPLITLMSNKKQPSDMLELLSSFLFKDNPEMKKILKLIPKPKNQEIIKNEFPDTNKVSISSLRKI